MWYLPENSPAFFSVGTISQIGVSLPRRKSHFDVFPCCVWPLLHVDCPSLFRASRVAGLQKPFKPLFSWFKAFISFAGCGNVTLLLSGVLFCCVGAGSACFPHWGVKSACLAVGNQAGLNRTKSTV